jgi:hypothetical protein
MARILLYLSVALMAGGCAQAEAGRTGVTDARGGGGLAVSRASGHRVQRQPPAGSCHARGKGRFSLPDPRCTPGAIDPAVTQRNISRTICVRGYTERIRPPESITEPEKRASLRAYGDRRPLHDYEYDHWSLSSWAAP